MGDKLFWTNTWGGVLCVRKLMINPCQGGRGSFINAFASNWNTVNLKIFPNHGGIFTWRWWSLDHSIELWKDLFLKLIVKRGQRLCRVQFSSCDPELGYWYIIWTVNTRKRELNLKNTLCILSLWGRNFLQHLFWISLVVTCLLMPWL